MNHRGAWAVDAKTLDIERPGSLIGYLKATGRYRRGRRARGERAGGRRLEQDGARRAARRRGVGAEAGAAQAARRGRLVQRPRADPPRGPGLRWLPGSAPPGTITPLVFEDPENHLLAMEAVPQPHENWKSMLLAGRVEDDHVGQFGRLLGDDPPRRLRAPKARSALVFDDRTFFESLRLEPYYAYTADAGPEPPRIPHAYSWRRPAPGADARPRRLQPEERPRPRRPARAARPRGDPLRRPGVRPRLRPDAPAQQGQPPPRTTRRLRARGRGSTGPSTADEVGDLPWTAGPGGTGGRGTRWLPARAGRRALAAGIP